MIQLRHTYLPEGYENGPPPPRRTRLRTIRFCAAWLAALGALVALMALSFLAGAVLGAGL